MPTSPKSAVVPTRKKLASIGQQVTDLGIGVQRGTPTALADLAAFMDALNVVGDDELTPYLAPVNKIVATMLWVQESDQSPETRFGALVRCGQVLQRAGVALQKGQVFTIPVDIRRLDSRRFLAADATEATVATEALAASSGQTSASTAPAAPSPQGSAMPLFVAPVTTLGIA